MNIETLSLALEHGEVVIHDLTTGQTVAMSITTAAHLCDVLSDLVAATPPMPPPWPPTHDVRPADWRRRW